VLFTNVDLGHSTGGQKGQLREKILEGYDRPGDVRAEIVGAAELASFLNEVPYLRSAFFGAPDFSTVEEEWLKHSAEKPFGADAGLVGRNDEVARAGPDLPHGVDVLGGRHALLDDHQEAIPPRIGGVSLPGASGHASSASSECSRSNAGKRRGRRAGSRR
jgi:hypothetical protein